MRKPTARLVLRACHDLPQCLVAGHAHAISVRSLEKLVGHFASPDGPRLITSTRNMDLKTPLRPVRAQELKGWPINGFDNRSGHLQGKEVERDGPASGQNPSARAPRASRPTFESRPDTIHGFSLKKGREPLGPVERTRELYGLTAENLGSVTS